MAPHISLSCVLLACVGICAATFGHEHVHIRVHIPEEHHPSKEVVLHDHLEDQGGQGGHGFSGGLPDHASGGLAEHLHGGFADHLSGHGHSSGGFGGGGYNQHSAGGYGIDHAGGGGPGGYELGGYTNGIGSTEGNGLGHHGGEGEYTAGAGGQGHGFGDGHGGGSGGGHSLGLAGFDFGGAGSGRESYSTADGAGGWLGQLGGHHGPGHGLGHGSGDVREEHHSGHAGPNYGSFGGEKEGGSGFGGGSGAGYPGLEDHLRDYSRGHFGFVNGISGGRHVGYGGYESYRGGHNVESGVNTVATDNGHNYHPGPSIFESHGYDLGIGHGTGVNMSPMFYMPGTGHGAGGFRGSHKRGYNSPKPGYPHPANLDISADSYANALASAQGGEGPYSKK